jgi:NAD(P)-dependent dehydrogenase (short-subunit alcohol dehydrogenase family)
MAGWASYGAAKAATAMWTQCAGAEQDLLARGNCVVWIAPGVVATPMQAKIRTADESVFPDVAQFQALHDDGILTTTTDVADAIWSILDGTFVNGAVLDVRDL